jgi:hypothetical protein
VLPELLCSVTLRLVPSATVTRFGVTWPGTMFRLDASGRAWPAG